MMARLASSPEWAEFRAMVEERVSTIEDQIIRSAADRCDWEVANALAARIDELGDMVERPGRCISNAAQAAKRDLRGGDQSIPLVG